MKEQVNARLDRETRRKLQELAARHDDSITTALAVAIDRAWRDGRPVFRLDVYTWPAMCGTPADIRTTEHLSTNDAIAHLAAETLPYAYAVLLKRVPDGWAPCTWEGRPVLSREPWPLRYGTNRDHPAYIALVHDWSHLVEECKRIHAETTRPTLDIAADLLAQQHPQTTGWAETLGREAAGGEGDNPPRLHLRPGGQQ